MSAPYGKGASPEGGEDYRARMRLCPHRVTNRVEGVVFPTAAELLEGPVDPFSLLVSEAGPVRGLLSSVGIW